MTWALVQFYPISIGGGQPDNSLPGGGGFNPVDPGYGQGGGGPRPDQGLPWQPGHVGNRPPGSYPGRPDQGLPGSPGHPDQGLPGSPGHPDQGLPPSAQPKPAASNVPEKPSSPPTGGEGTYVLVMVAPGVAKWAWVAGSGQIDAAPPSGTPPTAGTPLPPTPAPKK